MKKNNLIHVDKIENEPNSYRHEALERRNSVLKIIAIEKRKEESTFWGRMISLIAVP